MDDDVSRRQFMALGGTSLLTLGTGGTFQVSQNNQENFRGVADLIGPAAERPAPDSAFFDNKSEYAYVYEDYAGSRSYITDDDSNWQELNYTKQVNVFSSDDLPDPTNGTHTLENDTAYKFYGFVTSNYGIELGDRTPLLGRHGSLDGFIHLGGNTAITGTNSGYFSRNLYMHAPGGTMFDLTADQTTEMLVESVSFSDAAGLGDIANLGTIEGYRVPSFKGCNFENFAAGLTFDGTPRKIFFEGCPIRRITSSGVTVFELASTLDVDIFKLSTDCYVKEVQADTEVIRVNAGGEPTDYLKIINVDLTDQNLQRSNVLVGALDETSVGVIVTDSYPLGNTKVTADLDLDSSTTVTGSGSGPAQIAGGNISSTTTLTNSERMQSQTAGVLEYIGKPDQKLTIHANASVSGSNTEFAIYIGKNGSEIARSRSLAFLPNNSNATGAVALAEVALQTNDTVSAYLSNEGGTRDLDCETLSLTV